MFEFLLSFSPCCLWFFSACRLGRWEKWLACLVIHGCILIFALFIFLKNPLTPNLCLINASAFTSLLFGFCFRENTDQYVFLCFAYTHILFSFDHIFFFTVTGMNHYCSMYTYQLHQSEAKKMNLYFLGKNEWGRYFTFISSAGLAIPQFTFLFT